jgi:RNA polymerase sigma-70 factor, ECF subfamily
MTAIPPSSAPARSGSAALLADVAAGNSDAWDDLVRTHAQTMFRVAMRLIGDRQLAEDACQEAFLLIRDHGRKFRPSGDDPDALAQAWIIRAVCYAAWTVRRTQRNKIRRDARAAEGHAMTRTQPDHDDPVLLQQVRDQVEQLRPKLRDPLVLVYFNGSSQEQAASMLRISLGTLRVRLHRALTAVRRQMSPQRGALDAGVISGVLLHLKEDHAFSEDLLPKWKSLYSSQLHAAPATAASLATGVSLVTTVSITAILGAAIAITSLCINTGGAADAAKKDAKVERKGALAGLPSQPGAHIAKIKALGDGQWLALGAPQADAKWGTACGRSWSAKMVYAPDVQGAFFNGQGQHGFIKPDGYFMDDIWFYDVNGHRWICLYPGMDTVHFSDNIKKGDLKINDRGQLVDKNGDAIPFNATPGHVYQYHTYDTDEHKYIFGHGRGGIGSEQHSNTQDWYKQGAPLLQQQSKGDKVATTPYYFNTITGKFERNALGGERFPVNDGPVGAVNFYLPTKKLLFYFQPPGQTYLADPKTNKCWNAGAAGPTPEAMADVGACYDSKRDRIYLGRSGYAPAVKPGEGNVYIYDVKANAWSCPANKPNAGGFPSSNYGFVHYDVANDRVIAFSLADLKGSISIYNPENGEWEAGTEISADIAGLHGCHHGFYSPELNAHFLYLAMDSDPRGQMWAYRYKNVEKKGK